MDPISLVTYTIALVPVSYWPIVGKYAIWSVVMMLIIEFVVWVLDNFDSADGRIDWPRVHKLRSKIAWLGEFALALLKMLPVRTPNAAIAEGLKAMQDLLRDPHPDDHIGDK